MTQAPRAAGRLFLLLVAVVAVYRLTLIERGTLAFVDETCYFTSVMVLQAIGAGDLHGALSHITTNCARPGASLIQLPVALLQAIPSAFGVAASNPRSLLVPAVFNVGVSLTTLWFFFTVAVALCEDAWAALAAAVLYALLVNSNIYVRHLVPYDWALAVGACAMWLGVTGRRTVWLAARTGLLAGVMVTIYPGYYALAPVVGIAIGGQLWAQGPRRAAQSVIVFGAAVAVVIAAAELICRAGGVSYIGNALALSRTIGMGAFDEGWTFLPAYLIQVEHLSGIALLVGTAVGLWRAVAGLRRGALGAMDWLLVPAFAGWLWQAASSAELHRMVLYGRLIHPWLLFMAWALAAAMAAIDRKALRTVACAMVVVVSVVSWAPSALAYYHLVYPSDVLYALRIDTTRLPAERMACELAPGTWYASPGPLNRATRYPYTDATNYRLVNFCQALGLTSPPPPPSGMEVSDGVLLVDGPHWMTYPAYGFEGLPPDVRAAVAGNRYRVRAYRTAPP